MKKIILLTLTIFYAFSPMFAMQEITQKITYAQACECLGVKQNATPKEVIKAFIKKKNNAFDKELIAQAYKVINHIINKRNQAKLDGTYDCKPDDDIIRTGLFSLKQTFNEYDKGINFNTIEVDKYDCDRIVIAGALGIITLVVASYFVWIKLFQKS